MKRLLKALIFSNVLVAAGAGALTLGSGHLWGTPAGELAGLGALVFCATLAVYSLDRWVEGRGEDRLAGSVRHVWLQGHRRTMSALIGVGLIGAGLSLWWVRLETVLALIPPGMVSVGYSLPVLVWRSARLKDVPGFKTPATALVWAAVTCGLPLVESGAAVSPQVAAWLVGERTLFIYALTLPFDVRDLQSDRLGGVLTLAGRLGEARCFDIAQVAASVVVLSALLRGLCGVAFGQWATALASLAALGLLLAGKRRFAARRPPGELYYAGGLDGLILVQALLLLLG
ncbi:hypothetical protein DL240_03595 [Lujinxingia litoralis]|uniref:Prenyltransferase n=1 Tax=Lujinxingia litoralis TaxID=2211119 RepID=A0A328C9J8_9DELT|nr:hypothetical protein [Lujinxingia litoralis]RAL25307.1 hypothetical protein DL240_03595 [Lujinxingia litoralis]